MTFDEARKKMDECLTRATEAVADGQPMARGVNILRSSILESLEVMRSLVDTIEQEFKR